MRVGGVLRSAPTQAEAEVSLFGPGFGECVLTHLGRGEWIAIDSCRDSETGEPVALRYLRERDVDPASALRCVVATHWHNDHIDGLAALLRASEAADFVCSAAMTSEEAARFFGLVKESPRLVQKGLEELEEIIALLEGRWPAGARARGAGPRLAAADRRILARDLEDRANGYEVWCLSPSDASINLANREFAEAIQDPSFGSRRLRPRSPNHYSVVLWMRIGGVAVLLGGDLEQTGDPRRGWTAILGSRARPREMASVFKVPHHGAANADEDRIWAERLEPNVVAALTPYLRGDQILPSSLDRERLCKRTPNVFCTGTPWETAPRQRDVALERIIGELGRSPRPRRGPMGHVQIRWTIGTGIDSLSIGLGGGAVRLR